MGNSGGRRNWDKEVAEKQKSLDHQKIPNAFVRISHRHAVTLLKKQKGATA